jgi:Spy/CpxP family protein refolding chaperone
MKRSVKIGIAVAGVALLATLAGGAALASGRGPEHFAKRRVTRHIDAALDAVQATPQQRAAIHAARDHVFDSMAATHQDRAGEMAQALALWQADKLDETKVTALRARHVANAQKVGDAIVQAVHDAHDALTADQRQKLAAYAKSHRPAQMDGARPFFQHMINERIDDLLDDVHATDNQRSVVKAAAERAFTAIGESMSDHGQTFDQAVGVFTADQLDAQAVAQLRTQHQARAQKVGDAVIQALREIHDVLDAQQRQQVADWVRAHHRHHGG